MTIVLEASCIQQLQQLRARLAALVFYHDIRRQPAMVAFEQILSVSLGLAGCSGEVADGALGCGAEGLESYGRWVESLAIAGVDWTDWVILQIALSDNWLSRQLQAQDPAALNPALVVAAQQDLATLQAIAQAPWAVWLGALAESQGVTLVPWQAPELDMELAQELRRGKWVGEWAMALPLLASVYRRQGVGDLARYGAFRWQGGDLRGIGAFEPVPLTALVGYESQKATLVANTERLLAGYPALNVLLYGARGTGKSSLVKGLLPVYRDRGLRLLEVAKVDLGELPRIVERLGAVPQKFIVFVDDLSFEADDEAFKSLKVLLEGSLSACPANVVVYATSNRRHLIREFQSDRPRPRDAEEIHGWDTVQEKLSFSDRFGLTLTFEPADQDTYLAIVYHLAERAGLAIASADLEFQACQWAIRHNGRSGRTARQFVDWLRGEEALRVNTGK